MSMSASGVTRGLVVALLASVVVGGLAYRYLIVGSPDDGGSPPELVAQAKKALEKVKDRKLGATLRPATYDAILGPLDKLLRIARSTLQSPAYDPMTDYEKIRACTEPVIELAQLAHAQAQRETSFLKKDYRFMEQKGDACQYLATVTWNRLEAMHYQANPQGDAPFIPSPNDSEKLYSILESGLDANPDNKQLWYLHAAVARVNGSFAQAEKDLRKALELDADFVAAWNDLGLVMINLKQFDDAERAFTKAKERAAEAARRAGVPPGADYTTALANLVSFHTSLAEYYRRAMRADSGRENKAQFDRHQEAAEAGLRELAAVEPPNSPLLKELRGEVQGR